MMKHSPAEGEIQEIMRRHDLWMQYNEEGVKANLDNFYLQGAYLPGLNLFGADIRYVNLKDASLQASNFSEATFTGSSLCYANLTESDLSSAYMEGVNLRSALMRNTKLCGATLYGATLSWANLSDADLKDTDLREARLEGAKLENVDFTGADLSGADLTSAKLMGANLSACLLHKTIGNGKEIMTVQTSRCHVNITDYEIWINKHHYQWDQWMAFSDVEIEKMDLFDHNPRFTQIEDTKKDGLIWWLQWKPVLSQIIETRKIDQEITKEMDPKVVLATAI